MTPAAFDYAAPATIAEAVGLLASRPGARALANGKRLIRELKLRQDRAELLVDLSRVDALRGIVAAGDGGLRVGAMTTLAELAAEPAATPRGALLDAIGQTGDRADRNWVTIGGVLADVDPAAHLPAALLALGARLDVVGPGGSRSIDMAEALGPGGLGPADVIAAIALPAVADASAYVTVRDPASLGAIVGVAAAVSLDASGHVAACRVAVTGAAETPALLSGAAAALRGKGAGGVVGALDDAGRGLVARGDLVASAEYRRHLIAVLAADAVGRAIERSTVR
jgi:carbon-monoxide dehydrogenase medium subunit